MTIQQLNQYRYLQPRIRRLRREVAGLRTQQWRDSTVTDDQTEKQVELHRTEGEQERIAAFIDAVRDVRLHEIMTRRFLYGDTWAEVAAQLGESEGALKMAVKRFLSRCTD